MRRSLVILLLVLSACCHAGCALAQTPASGPPGHPAPTSAPAGNTDANGGTVSAQPPPNMVIPSCQQPTQQSTAAAPPVSITINPATIWQPRGGEVIVAVAAEAALFKGFTVRACFGWSGAAPDRFFTEQNLSRFMAAFVRVRPSDTFGQVNLGIIIPSDLKDAPSSLFTRWTAGQRSTGLGLVPIVDLRLIGYNDTGVLFDIVRPVGVTSVRFSLSLAVLSVIVGVLVLHRLATGAFPAPPPRRDAKPLAMALQYLKELLKFRWVLYLVQNGGGRASLSAFQILLWSILVAASAIYVMALSGSLINITSGTLVLLGIAGAAGLITAGADKIAQPGVPPAVPQPRPQRIPGWADLVRDDSGTPEVTRLQMLFFTVVSATFVAMQVLNNYVIPDIPSGYQILMGISNGIYVGRKFT